MALGRGYWFLGTDHRCPITKQLNLPTRGLRSEGEDSRYLCSDRARCVLTRKCIGGRHRSGPTGQAFSVSVLAGVKTWTLRERRRKNSVVLMQVADFYRESATRLGTTAKAPREPGNLSPKQWVTWHVVGWYDSKLDDCGVLKSDSCYFLEELCDKNAVNREFSVQTGCHALTKMYEHKVNCVGTISRRCGGASCVVNKQCAVVCSRTPTESHI